MKSIRLLLPGAESPQTLRLPSSATLQQLSTLTSELPSVPQAHTLRFIHAGQFLTDLKELPENAVIHVAVTTQPRHTTLDIDETPPERAPRTDWIAGLCMGMLMGAILLVLTQDRTIALSRKCRTGVSIGVTINILFGLVLIITDR